MPFACRKGEESSAQGIRTTIFEQLRIYQVEADRHRRYQPHVDVPKSELALRTRSPQCTFDVAVLTDNARQFRRVRTYVAEDTYRREVSGFRNTILRSLGSRLSALGGHRSVSLRKRKEPRKQNMENLMSIGNRPTALNASVTALFCES